MGTSDRSEIDVNERLKQRAYAPEIVMLVMKLRSASYKMGRVDLVHFFEKTDLRRHGYLDAAEFRNLVHRFV